MGFKKNNIIQNFENNLSVKNLNEFMTNEFNGDNETLSLINLFILDTQINDTAYYDNLDTNIHYFNEDYIFAKVKINEIDCSFYNTNTIKEYLFMTSFLSDFYKSKYKNTNQNNVAREYSVNNNTINIKLKFGFGIYSGNIESIWHMSSKKYEFVPIEVTFNNIKNSFERDVTIGTLNEQPNRIWLFNVQEKNKYTTDFNTLFNKIKSEIKDELNKNRYYYNSVFLSYKYAYYNILLNYNTIRLYYRYIKKKGIYSENSKLIKYQDIYEILLKFYELFSSYEIKLDELIIIIKSVELVDEISESEKNENAKIAINKLQQINYNLLENHDYIKNNYRKVKITKTDIQTNKIKIIVISLLMILSFITFFITINYYSLNTSKLLSIIILSIIVCVILINNYIIKNKTYENFDSTMLPPDSNRADLMSKEYLDSLHSLSLENSEIQTEGTPTPPNETIQNTIYIDLQESLDDKTNTTIDSTKYSDAKKDFKELTAKYELAKINHVGKITGINEKIKDMELQIKAISTKVTNAGTMLETKVKQLGTINKLKSSLDSLIAQQNDATAASERLESTYKSAVGDYRAEMDARLAAITTTEGYTTAEDSSTGVLTAETQGILEDIADIESKIVRKGTDKLAEEEAAAKARSALTAAGLKLSTATVAAADAAAALADQRVAFDSGSHELQVAAAKAAEDAAAAKTAAEQEEKIVSEIHEKGLEAIRIIKAKIKALKAEFDSRPKDITYEIKLDLKYDFVTNNTDFHNKILLELSLMLLVPLSRFKLKNISSDNDDNIKLEIIFSPSRLNSTTTYSNSDLITTFENIFKTPAPETGAAKYHLDFILNTKYLKFITEITKKKDGVSVPGQNASFPNKLAYTTEGNLIKKFDDCNTKMAIIKGLIAELDSVDFNPNTYYNEINPRLNLEVKKYSEKNTRIDNDTNILDSKTDILIHDYINSHYIYKHLSYITFLLSFVFLSYSYLNDYILVIYIIATIIFFIIVLHLYIDIYKNVRRKSKKKYWVKPFKV